MSLDLNKLTNNLDEALSNETTETLTKFLNDKRMTNNKQQTEMNKEFVPYELALELKQLGFEFGRGQSKMGNIKLTQARKTELKKRTLYLEVGDYDYISDPYSIVFTEDELNKIAREINDKYSQKTNF
jgi:hypothetical protein